MAGWGWWNMKKDVEIYISKQKSPQREMLVELREIFFKALPGYDERIAWGVIVFGKSKFYLAAMKDRVHVGFSIIGLSSEEVKLFEGSGKTMRHIKIHSLGDIEEKRLVELIRLVDEKASCVEQ